MLRLDKQNRQKQWFKSIILVSTSRPIITRTGFRRQNHGRKRDQKNNRINYCPLLLASHHRSYFLRDNPFLPLWVIPKGQPIDSNVDLGSTQAPLTDIGWCPTRPESGLSRTAGTLFIAGGGLLLVGVILAIFDQFKLSLSMHTEVLRPNIPLLVLHNQTFLLQSKSCIFK